MKRTLQIIILSLFCFALNATIQAQSPDRDQLINGFVSMVSLQTQNNPTFKKACHQAALALRSDSRKDDMEKTILILELEKLILTQAGKKIFEPEIVMEAKENLPGTAVEIISKRMEFYMKQLVLSGS